MVFRERGIPARIIGTDEREARGRTLRTGDSGIGRREGPKDHPPGDEEMGLARERFGRTSEGRREEGANGQAIAAGNDNDVVMDCPTIEDGNKDASVTFALLA